MSLIRISLCFVLLVIITIETEAKTRFIDNEGECWDCYSSYPCVRCIRNYQDIMRLWNPKCVEPNCRDRNLRHLLFPSRDASFYFQCTSDNDLIWVSTRRECQCELLFDFEKQTCVPLPDWKPFCLEFNFPLVYKDCQSGEWELIGDKDYL